MEFCAPPFFRSSSHHLVLYLQHFTSFLRILMGKCQLFLRGILYYILLNSESHLLSLLFRLPSDSQQHLTLFTFYILIITQVISFSPSFLSSLLLSFPPAFGFPPVPCPSFQSLFDSFFNFSSPSLLSLIGPQSVSYSIGEEDIDFLQCLK